MVHYRTRHTAIQIALCGRSGLRRVYAGGIGGFIRVRPAASPVAGFPAPFHVIAPVMSELC